MKRIILFVMLFIMMILVGCSTQRYDSEYVRDANWTSDGKIVYLVEKKSTWIQRNPIYEQQIKKSTVATLWECDSDGSNKREIGEIDSTWADISYYGISSVGNKVVMSLVNIYIINRDGSGLKKIGKKGFYPSISPDGSKVVYKEWGGGIRMMNIDGSNDHIFLDDTSLTNPQWSPDGGYISTSQNNVKLKIYNESGVLKKVLNIENMWTDTISYLLSSGYCWSTNSENSIFIQAYFSSARIYKGSKIEFNYSNDSLNISYYGYYGSRFKIYNDRVISEGSNGIMVMDIDGNNKWYLVP